jgi:hypothetical protein
MITTVNKHMVDLTNILHTNDIELDDYYRLLNGC